MEAVDARAIRPRAHCSYVRRTNSRFSFGIAAAVSRASERDAYAAGHRGEGSRVSTRSLGVIRAKAVTLAISFFILPAGSADAAESDRTAVLRDGVDRTVSYDVAEIRARLQQGLGKLTLTVRMNKPFPVTAPDHSYGGISINVAGRPSFGSRCGFGGGVVVGHTTVIIDPRREAPTSEMPEIHVAQARVAHRDASVDLPVQFSADRRTATIVVEDNLLRKADLRCLDARATGRGPRDASLPQGGPTSDDVGGVYFAGFSPQARLRKLLKSCNRRYRGSRNASRRARCRSAVKARPLKP